MFSLPRILIIVVIFVSTSDACSHHTAQGWTYDKPDEWGTTFPKCMGGVQSPIDIVTREAVKDSIKDVDWRDWHKQYDGLVTYNKVINKAVTFSSSHIGESKIVLDCEVYRLERLDYHWGTKVDDGSEHSIDGRKYAAETQLMFYKEKYESFDEATKHKGGVAVVVNFLEMDEEMNKDIPMLEGYKYLLKYFKTGNVSFDIPEKGNKLKTEDFLPECLDAYRYTGTLSQPPCTHGVEWVILKRPIRVTMSFAKLLWDLDNLGGNLRPQSSVKPTVYEVSGVKTQTGPNVS